MNGMNETEVSKESSIEEFQNWQRTILRLKEAECQLLLDKIYHDQSNADLDGHCSSAWDNVFCWPAAQAGETVRVPCPNYVHMFSRHAEATKFCTENGTWFVHPETGKPWANYSMCIINEGEIAQDSLIMEWLPIIKTISQVGYSVSLCTLIIAFLILISIKKLRCPRNTLHMHLFGAFMALLKDSLFIDGVGLPQSIVDGTFMQEQSNWECKLVTTLWQYFILANYSWILMEGLYLHQLIFFSFSETSIWKFGILGWGLPLPVIISWIVCRIEFDDSLCWTTHHNNANLFLIIRIPIIASIALNFIFFINITRVLLVKLQSAVSIETRKYRYRKWAKSTLILVPLFGVHYMMFMGMSYYMGINPLIEIIWLFCDQLFASFQGFCVAILYCLLNGEVRSEITKKWRGWRSESDAKNVWVPLHHLTSRFNNHRSTQEIGMSGTSMPVLSNCNAVKQTDNTTEQRLNRENTEEHQIEITQGD